MTSIKRASIVAAMVIGLALVGGATGASAAAPRAMTEQAASSSNVRPDGAWLPYGRFHLRDDCISYGIDGKNRGLWAAYNCAQTSNPSTDYWPWELDVFYS